MSCAVCGAKIEGFPNFGFVPKGGHPEIDFVWLCSKKCMYAYAEKYAAWVESERQAERARQAWGTRENVAGWPG